MANKFYKNDYRIRKVLRDFANENPIGKVLKPLFKDLYKFANKFLPYPRDFLLREIPKNSLVCEVGVYEGDLSERILKISKPKKLYLVDPWAAITTRSEKKYNQASQDIRLSNVKEKFKDELSRGQVEIIRKTSDEAATDFPPKFFDFIYIDGDHSYEQVKKDLDTYFTKVKSGGELAGDDYQIPSVKQAVDEFAIEKNIPVRVRNFQFVFQK